MENILIATLDYKTRNKKLEWFRIYFDVKDDYESLTENSYSLLDVDRLIESHIPKRLNRRFECKSHEEKEKGAEWGEIEHVFDLTYYGHAKRLNREWTGISLSEVPESTNIILEVKSGHQRMLSILETLLDEIKFEGNFDAELAYEELTRELTT